MILAKVAQAAREHDDSVDRPSRGGRRRVPVKPAAESVRGSLLLRVPERVDVTAWWLFGVSLLDVAPYMFDALHPQLMLLSGTTGEAGGHHWIHLFSSMGMLRRAQTVGALTHKLGALVVVLVVVLALAWAAWLLRLQRHRCAGDVVCEE